VHNQWYDILCATLYMVMWNKCLRDGDMQSEPQTDVMMMWPTRTKHHNPDTGSTLQLNFLC